MIDHKKIREWYNSSGVKFQIIKYTFNRECALLTPSFVKSSDLKKFSVRMLKIHSVNHIDFVFLK